ncbi:Thiol-disulfide oxidoreductase ResA [uncultured archaeon]|nr:Thiol-disulfide oxidoreductase ResA [uncultured archaeon]
MGISLIGQEIRGVKDWINSGPLALSGLKGKVVLVEFWDYSCVNCQRTLPVMRELWKKYKDKGLVIIGVHTPEYEFGKDLGAVKDAVKRDGLEYPVALDNSYMTWRAFGNRFWPEKYLFDAKGALRFKHAGEGAYEETEKKVRELLAENGADLGGISEEPLPDHSYPDAITPEIYLGSARSKGFGSGKVCTFDGSCGYIDPGVHSRNAFYLSGMWDVESEYAETGSDSLAQLILKFYAMEVNLIMSGPKGKTATVKVFLDGKKLAGEEAGEDVGKDGGAVKAGDTRMYRIYSSKEYGEHEIRLDFNEQGVKCYAFTFG